MRKGYNVATSYKNEEPVDRKKNNQRTDRHARVVGSMHWSSGVLNKKLVVKPKHKCRLKRHQEFRTTDTKCFVSQTGY